jgi:FKBP-type peptidyl-prolyl cis-trans isomerase
MKKFLVLPILLAIGFGILIIVNTESTGGGNKEDESGYVTTKSGLKYKDEKVGDGKEAKTGDTVVVNYTGRLKDGSKFDSSFDHGEPFTFKVGGRVIAGWNEGVPGMKVGGTRKLIIPPELGYGKQGSGSKIPPDAELRFDIELLDVK